jgi:hypothetical protein
MSMYMATCGKTPMAGSYAELGRMVSMAVQAVPYALLFPFTLLSFSSAFPANEHLSALERFQRWVEASQRETLGCVIQQIAEVLAEDSAQKRLVKNFTGSLLALRRALRPPRLSNA